MRSAAAAKPAQQAFNGARSPSRRHPARHRAPPPSAATGRRRLLSIAVPLLWLPWRGCDQGGSYSTGEQPEVMQEEAQPGLRVRQQLALPAQPT